MIVAPSLPTRSNTFSVTNDFDRRVNEMLVEGINGIG
jgi:hypothetical protein